MNLSRREKYIALVTFSIGFVLLADRLILSPWLGYRRELRVERELLLDRLERNRVLASRQQLYWESWQAALGNTLQTDQAGAESQILHALRNWADESGLAVSSVRPERLVEHSKMQEMILHVTATGTMNRIVGFLVRLESSDLPVRVVEMQMGTRTDGIDDLMMQLRISTLFTID